VYGQLFSVFLAALYHAMDGIPNLKPGEIGPFLAVLEDIRDSGLFDRFNIDMSARLADVEARVRELSAGHIAHKYEELSAQPGANCAIPLLFLSDEIENTAKKLDKRFPQPLLGYTSPVAELCVTHDYPGRLILCRWSWASRSHSSSGKLIKTERAFLKVR
jgi:hypothetical protein